MPRFVLPSLLVKQELMPADLQSNSPLVRMTAISKRFGRTKVLHEVDFELLPGEVHILAGENGAGKSTLIKILAGVHSEFQGTMEVNNREVHFRSTMEANSAGIAVIHQELSLIGSMSVADNMFLGRTPSRWGFVQGRTQKSEATKWLQHLGIAINPSKLIEQYPVATQQCIEIAKALSQHANIIVMDEPTSALSDPEVERLFDLIEQLKQQNCGIIYISHKMDEIERIADRITVLRDGRLVGSAPARDLPRAKLIQWMVGREVQEQFPRHSSHQGNIRLRVENLLVPSEVGEPTVNNACFEVAEGEIVGIGGLQGSGASEVLLALFGALGKVGGRVELDGKPLEIRSPRHAIDHGIALLTNDRKSTGLVLPMSIAANITLASLPRHSRGGWRSSRIESQVATRVARSLRIRAASLALPVETLSGGNQQKVAIAKWLETQPKLLLLDEPTRGIDVGAKREIYELMEQWAAEGIAILLISSELPELLALSDRILVMHRGAITAELDRENADANKVLAAAMATEVAPSGA